MAVLNLDAHNLRLLQNHKALILQLLEAGVTDLRVALQHIESHIHKNALAKKMAVKQLRATGQHTDDEVWPVRCESCGRSVSVYCLPGCMAEARNQGYRYVCECGCGWSRLFRNHPGGAGA